MAGVTGAGELPGHVLPDASRPDCELSDFKTEICKTDQRQVRTRGGAGEPRGHVPGQGGLESSAARAPLQLLSEC